jgi:hypothetical protein
MEQISRLGQIAQRFEEVTGVSVSMLRARGQDQNTVMIRQVFINIAYTNKLNYKYNHKEKVTLQSIGKYLGYDHSTIHKHLMSSFGWTKESGFSKEIEMLNKFN